MEQKTIIASLLSILYVVSSSGETLTVKALNYNEVPLKLPTYTAFMSNQMWLFMIPVYWYLQREKCLFDTKYMMQYMGMGILTFAITLMRNISVNMIPGSIFLILISTSIIFNMILSSICLKKKFNKWHIASGITCLSSAVSISIDIFFSNENTMSDYNFTVGIPTAIGAALFIAVMSVWQEQTQSQYDDINLRVVEMTIVSSLIASILTIIFSFITGEIFTWSPLIEATKSNNSIILIGVSIALPILKLIVRNSKYSIIQRVNAFFFEFIQSSSALFGSLASIILFNERWGFGYIISILLLTASFGMYSHAKKIAKNSLIKPDFKEVAIENPLKTLQFQTVIVVSVWK